jgi:nitrite reductase/ring-hydroxylating ferredoxin subunit
VASYVVGRTTDVEPGRPLIVDVAGRSIGVLEVEGRYYAVRNRCPHAGAELCRGRVLGSVESPSPGVYVYDTDRKFLECPWHGWEFDLDTGESFHDGRACRARTYGVEVVGAAEGERIPGAHRLDTFTVDVEGEFLLVEVPD